MLGCEIASSVFTVHIFKILHCVFYKSIVAFPVSLSKLYSVKTQKINCQLCCQWQRAKIPPYCWLCGAVIADYGGKNRNIDWYLQLQRARKPPCISAMTPLLYNTHCQSSEFHHCTGSWRFSLISPPCQANYSLCMWNTVIGGSYPPML